jgi:hypothetical protein
VREMVKASWEEEVPAKYAETDPATKAVAAAP